MMSLSRKNFLTKVILLSTTIFLYPDLSAQTFWNNPGVGDWNIAANWLPPAVPTAADTTEIQNGGEAQLSAAPAGNALDLFVDNNSKLLVQTGAMLSIMLNTRIATQINSIADVTVTGTGTSWATHDLILGQNLGAQGTINIEDGASVFSRNVFLGFSGGTGIVNALGSGSSWLISAQLNVGQDPGGQGTVNIGDGASVTSNLLSLVGVFGGTGIVNVSGLGTSWTSNALTISFGANAQGTVNIEDGANVFVPTAVTLADNATGIATLNLNGTAGARGVLTTLGLSGGPGTHTINFDGGILRASADNPTFTSGFNPGDLNIQAGGLFLDSQSFNIGIADDFSGVGQLTKLGSGTAILSGANTNNGANVNEGTLVIDGSLTGLVTVNSGATLQGNGIIGALTNGGTVAPGTGIGTLTVAGNHINLATGIHQNELNAAGQSDLLLVGGTSTLEGGTLELIAAPGNYLAGTSYTLILAAGGLSGTFDTVLDNIPINYFLSYFPNSLVLTLGDAVNLPGLTGNARRVADFINSFPFFVGDFLTVLTELQTLNQSDLEDALDQLHPAPFQALAITAGDAAHMINASFIDRLNFLRTTQCDPCDPCDQGGVWIAGLADFIRQDRSQGLRRFTATNGGVALGYDTCFCDNFIAGVGAGYANSTIRWSNSRGHSDGNNYYLGLYATQYEDNYYADASLLGFTGHYHSKRHIEFASIDRTAKSKQCSYGINPHFGAGLNLNYCSIDVVPFGEIDYIYVHQNKFHEHGADSLNLRVKKHHASILRLETGLRFAKVYDCCGYGQFLPNASISYVGHRYYGRKYTSSFNDQPTDFSVFGTDRCFNQVEFGVGFAYLINDNLAINTSYEIAVGSKRRDQEFNFEVNYKF